MGAHGGPNIPTGDLALSIDPLNQQAVQSYPRKTDHGISEWYCFVSGTARYARPLTGTTIYSIDTSGNISEVLSENSAPNSGTLSVVANYRYFANKPIHLMVEGAQERLVPASLYGTQFGSISSRYSSSTYYFHAPFSDATVSVYDNVVGGVTGAPTTTVSVSKGSSNTYVTATENAYVIFESDEPIVMCATEASGGDKRIIPPASTKMYRRRNAYEQTVNRGNPSTIGTYFVSDSVPCFAVEIADGAGGDSCHGLGYENLSNRYAFGNRISDYHIVAPFSNTRVKAFYYLNNKWNLYDTHNLNGSETNPAVVAVDGDGGSFDDSGLRPYIASSSTYLWYFESNNPILITINDTQDDEEFLLGWMEDAEEKTVLSSRSGFKNLSRKSATESIVVQKSDNIFDSTNDYIQLDGVDQRIQISNVSGIYDVGTNDFSISLWIYPQDFSSYPHLFCFDDQSMFALKAAITTGKIYFFGGSSYRSNTDEYGTWTLALNQWQHVGFVRDGTAHKAYYNGELIGSLTKTAKNITCDNVFIGWGNGSEYTQQRRGVTKFYNKALTNRQMFNSFASHRKRYGI